MAVSYKKLWKLLIDKDMKKKDLCARAGISPASVTKMGKEETKKLVDEYEVTKADAATMVNISKEFVNTYLDSGRKLSLGGREKSNFALSVREIPTTEKTYQRRHDDGKGNITWEPGKKTIPAHKGLKARSSCPSWVK